MYMQTKKEIAEYVGRTMKYGNDISNAVTNLLTPTFVEPVEPTPTSPAITLSKYQEKLFKKQVVEHFKRSTELEENIKTVYAIVWGQCTDSLREKIKALSNFNDMLNNGKDIQLLISIRDIVYKREQEKDMWHSYHEATFNLIVFKQNNLSNQHYFQQFQNLVDVVEHCGGSLGNVKALQTEMLIMIAKDIDNPTTDKMAKAIIKSKERFYATMFFLRADRNRYMQLHRSIQTDRLQGQDHYPNTLVEAYNLLVNWIPETTYRGGNNGPTNDGVAFANVSGKKGKGKTPPDIETVECYKCHKLGHYASSCPNNSDNNQDKEKGTNEDGHQFFNEGTNIEDYDDDESGFLFNPTGSLPATYKGVLCEINEDGRVDKNWILLDNQSTVDVFYNKELLRNIRQSKTGMEIHCNAGTTTTDTIGEFPGYGTVWFHPEGIANILSLARVSKRHRVTFDSSNGNEFLIHKKDGRMHRFKQSTKGLYYIDTAIEKGTTLVTTVEHNKSKYTTRDYSSAVSARRLQHILGFPSTQTFVKIVENKLLHNCPITKADVLAAESIFGPAVAC